jgi:O-succinylbenzoic acid--CoA ligase
MNDSEVDTGLSIRAAAQEAGELPAILTAHRTWTFRECAERAMYPEISIGVRADVVTAQPFVAASTVDTVLAVYRALQFHRPIALLHPRSPADVRERQERELAVASVYRDTAFVLFTSGSTGRPRGVVLSRAAIVSASRASAEHLDWREGDRWLACLPLAHAGGLSIIVRCLIARRPVALHEGDFDAPAVAALARTTGATLASFVPAQLDALLAEELPATLRAVLLGGAAASPQLVERALARDIPVLETYGLTETFGQVATACRPGEPPSPLPGVEIFAGTPAHPARIRIRGPMLASRYLDGTSHDTKIAPELETADLGYISAPQTGRRRLIIVGRADDVIISGGENVHPLEIEASVTATPGVRAACAFGVPDEQYGQIVGVAIVVGDDFDEHDAVAHWRRALPAHARPRRIAIVDALPLLPNGKIDRRTAAALPMRPVVQ